MSNLIARGMIGRTGWIAMTVLATAVGLVSLRYALPHPPGAAANVLANLNAAVALPIHAVGGSIALLIGPYQFLRTRDGQRRRWHCWWGAAYSTAVLAGGLAGLVLAPGATAGPIASAGFGLLAVAWLVCTAEGVRAAFGGRPQDHGRWMIRSYALTLAAVTLRLMLPLPGLLGLDFTEAYRAIAFLCWVPNLVVAELWLRRQRSGAREVAT